MTMLASQIISLTVVYSIVYSGVNQRKYQSSASLAFVREIHRGPVNFPHKWPVTRKMFPFDDVIMCVPNISRMMYIYPCSGRLTVLYTAEYHSASVRPFLTQGVMAEWLAHWTRQWVVNGVVEIRFGVRNHVPPQKAVAHDWYWPCYVHTDK